jgi:acetyl-CoA carboxylase biotin carboxyl carrier protein
VSLKAADVAEIMRLVEESSFDELTLEIDGLKLSLRRGSTGAVVNGAAFDSPPLQPPVAQAPQPQSAPPKAAVPAASDPNAQDVKAPLLGTFYRSPKPGAPPFVDVGASVEEDTVVAIIEVMKLMNTVRAGVRGVVTEIFAKDGALVEYDETILRVRKAG